MAEFLGQVNMFDLMGGFETILTEKCEGSLIPQDIPFNTLNNVSADDDKEDIMKYLQVEEKMTNLLKKRKSRNLKTSTLYNLFNQGKLKENDRDYVYEKLIKIVRDELNNCDFVEETGVRGYLSKKLNELLDDTNIFTEFCKSLIYTEEGSSIAAHFVSKKCTSNRNFQLIEPEQTTRKPYYWTLCELKKAQRGKYYRYSHQKNSEVGINDASIPFARAIMFTQVKKRMKQDADYEEYIREFLRKELSGYIIDNSFVCNGSSKDEGEAIADILKLQLYCVQAQEIYENGHKIRTYARNVYSSSKVDLCLELFGYHYSSTDYHHCRGYYLFGFDGILTNLFIELLKRDIEIESMIKYEKITSKDYALSFMTKKNIPEKTVKAMQESDFNNYFGYVEFDESCDIKKMTAVTKEWSALAETYFGGKKYADVSLRFRKLGNHNASGLYYSTYRCMCVDVRDTTSMVHEFFHMIDDGTLSGVSMDYLSLKGDFEKIRNRYGFLIEGVNFNKSSKYNKDYYKTPTEIFARCAEMYVYRVLGVNNSFVEECSGFAYPEDEELMNLITDYFDQLFITAFDYHRKEEKEYVDNETNKKVYRA